MIGKGAMGNVLLNERPASFFERTATPDIATRDVGGERYDLAGRFIIRLVAHAAGLCEADLLSGRRGAEAVSRARQTAMYLMHTAMSAPYGEVGRVFGRDRTTVAHACRAIEDSRDDLRTDTGLMQLEGIIETVLPLFATRLKESDDA